MVITGAPRSPACGTLRRMQRLRSRPVRQPQAPPRRPRATESPPMRGSGQLSQRPGRSRDRCGAHLDAPSAGVELGRRRDGRRGQGQAARRPPAERPCDPDDDAQFAGGGWPISIAAGVRMLWLVAAPPVSSPWAADPVRLAGLAMHAPARPAAPEGALPLDRTLVWTALGWSGRTPSPSCSTRSALRPPCPARPFAAPWKPFGVRGRCDRRLADPCARPFLPRARLDRPARRRLLHYASLRPRLFLGHALTVGTDLKGVGGPVPASSLPARALA